ncbi:MAG: putative tRNA-dihydrouridine synthase [Candidatus Anoxychlamydiales bacterium]|nr:putative tRNA-dihydrouridine synthase [Candidatus Anoxychlamydiales bacterium]
MKYKKNFELGSLNLFDNILYAPLAEYTDFAFRRLLRDFHKGLIFCEMTKMEALVREKSYRLLEYQDNMKPIGAQICGSDPTIAKDAAKIIEDLGFDLIDLNCGCPVNKVVKDGSGSAMLKDINSIRSVLENIIKAVKIPVTIKIRAGWDDNSIVVSDVVKIAEELGAKAITVHGRTRKQGYSGKSNLEYIKIAKETAKDIKIIGNGDLLDPKDVENMFNYTNCDGVMIARGMLFNPKISKDISNYFLNSDTKVDVNFKKNMFLKHIEYILEKNELRKAVLDCRRMGGWYLRGLKNIKYLRININKAKTIDEVINLINDFDWESIDD